MGQKVTSNSQAKRGTELSSFTGGGPATCMNCKHRTPHSKTAEGEEVDSCSHPVVMKDPEIPPEKRLPDGTIKVDADDWCEFFWMPEKEEGESPGHPASEQQTSDDGKKSVVGSIYMTVLEAMD